MSRLKLGIVSGLTAFLVLIAAAVMAVTSNSADIARTGAFKKLYICGADGKSLCNVGDIGPGGGTIFFIDYDNVHPEFNYLEVAPSNWAGSLGVDPLVGWCNNITKKIETNLTAWSSRSVGIGASNTAIMLQNCTSGAANLVGKYNSSTAAKKKDWYLPTIGCLLLMYYSLQGKADLVDGNYWSSSGYSNIGAWVQSMGRGYQGTASKDSLYRVRPVRSF